VYLFACRNRELFPISKIWHSVKKKVNLLGTKGFVMPLVEFWVIV
jgi:hypothetical protein